VTVDQSSPISQVFSKQQSSVTIFHQIKASTTVQDHKHHIHHHRPVFGRTRVSFRFVGFGRVIIVILGLGFWKDDYCHFRFWVLEGRCWFWICL
jgi:hypothetical protein